MKTQKRRIFDYEKRKEIYSLNACHQRCMYRLWNRGRDTCSKDIRRCLIAFATALACYHVFALWYNWYHFTESTIAFTQASFE